MFEGIFSGEAFQETLAIIQSEFLLATWETVYVTILASACAIIIGLPLGYLAGIVVYICEHWLFG